MFKTAYKSVLSHKLRLALTALAIVLGVAFVAGSFVFTDTIDARFDRLFTDVYAGVDASVRPEPPDLGEEQGSIDASLLTTVRAVEGIETAVPSVGGYAQLIKPDGTPVGGQGPPTYGFSWTEEPSLSSFHIAEDSGRAPAAPGEVAIDIGTAEANGFELGDEVEIQFASGTETFVLVGMASFGTEDNLAGATISLFEFSEAQRLLGLEGRFSQIDVVAAEGVEPEELVGRLQTAVPAGVEAVTGAQQGDEEAASFTEELGFVTLALLAFAGVAVFVGAFIISNTFRIIVAQRTRELALLRALGASRRQVTGMVLVEALIVGVVASAVGVVAGVGFSMLLKTAMDAAGFGMPEGPLTIAPRTVAVGMAVGVIVTLISSLLPARKAARVPPVAAMREVAPGRTPLRRRMIAGAGLFAAGGAVLAAGLILENGASLPFVAGGALGVFLGVAVLAPLLAGPIVALLGRPLPGVVGALARGNTVREPRRTAATASALMVGVALVAFVSIFGASIKASTTDALESTFPADLRMTSANFYVGVTPEAIDRIESVEELDVVSSVRMGEARVDGTIAQLTAVEASTIAEVFSPDSSVPLSRVEDGMLVAEDRLAERGWTLGERVAVEFPSGTVTSLEIVGTTADEELGPYLIDEQTFLGEFEGAEAAMVLARVAPGVALDDGKAAAELALAAFPAVTVNTASEFAADAEAQLDQILALFSALLGLAVVIAVIGIANTLALTTLERTREIGLLRAVGMGRRQLRRMVRWEAVMTSLFGAVLGIGLGSLLGYSVVLSLGDEGLGTFVFPVTQMLMWLALAGAAGIVAAIGPARKAARTNVLRAISFE